jgi:uncharacterized protein YcgI (DUF1989 family)
MTPIEVPAYGGRSYEIKAGQLLRVTDIEGHQIADWIAIGRDDLGEVLSGPETLNFEWRSRLRVGDRFWSSRRRPMFEIVSDDTKGVHDMTHAPCSKEFYAITANQPDHPNCRDNLLGAVSSYGITDDMLPNTVNLFQNTPPGADGATAGGPASAQAGESIVLRALIDSFGAVSSCSVDSVEDDGYANLNGSGCSPILIEVLDDTDL